MKMEIRRISNGKKIEEIIDDGRIAIMDNGDYVMWDTVLIQYREITAGDAVLAAQLDSFLDERPSWLDSSVFRQLPGFEGPKTALWFGLKDSRTPLVSCLGRLAQEISELHTVMTYVVNGPSGDLKTGVSSDFADSISVRHTAAMEEYYSLIRDAKAIYGQALDRILKNA
jgi:hypothetical protein